MISDEKDKVMTPEESLALISAMIQKARGSYHRFSFHFLWWGTLLFIQGLTEWIILNYYHSPIGNIGWGIASVIGGIGSAFYAIKQNKQSNSNDMNAIYNAIWLSYGMAIFSIIIISLFNRWNPTPLIIILTGLPTFLTGRMTRFVPFQIGGISFFIIGCVAGMTSLNHASLWFSLSMLSGYLIPGFLFRMRHEHAVS